MPSASRTEVAVHASPTFQAPMHCHMLRNMLGLSPSKLVVPPAYESGIRRLLDLHSELQVGRSFCPAALAASEFSPCHLQLSLADHTVHLSA